jgi:hypothetical protein
MTDISHSAGPLLRYMPRVQFRKQELRLAEVARDNLSLLSSLFSVAGCLIGGEPGASATGFCTAEFGDNHDRCVRSVAHRCP